MIAKMVLDRIEYNIAILIEQETESVLKCSKDFLPKEVKEGDVLKVTFEIDDKATKIAKEQAENLLNDLLKEE